MKQVVFAFVFFALMLVIKMDTVSAADHMMMGKYNKGKVEWPMVPDAHRIHMFYREKGMTNWPFAQPDLNGMNTMVHLNYLKQGVMYEAKPLIKLNNGTWVWGPTLPVMTMAM
jgi:hypothetical protein